MLYTVAARYVDHRIRQRGRDLASNTGLGIGHRRLVTSLLQSLACQEQTQGHDVKAVNGDYGLYLVTQQWSLPEDTSFQMTVKFPLLDRRDTPRVRELVTTSIINTYLMLGKYSQWQ